MNGAGRFLRKLVINRNKDSSLRSSGRKSGKGDELFVPEMVDRQAGFLKPGCANLDDWKSGEQPPNRHLPFPRLSQGGAKALWIVNRFCEK
jgi:hypothetical protein